MPEIIDYNRPKASPIADVPIPFKLLLAELPQSPAAVAVDGTTAGVDSYIEGQILGVWKPIFRMQSSHALNINGSIILTIIITPILGDGTNGIPVTFTYAHDQNMDTYQSAAGFGRP